MKVIRLTVTDMSVDLGFTYSADPSGCFISQQWHSSKQKHNILTSKWQVKNHQRTKRAPYPQLTNTCYLVYVPVVFGICLCSCSAVKEATLNVVLRQLIMKDHIQNVYNVMYLKTGNQMSRSGFRLFCLCLWVDLILQQKTWHKPWQQTNKSRMTASGSYASAHRSPVAVPELLNNGRSFFFFLQNILMPQCVVPLTF